MDFEFLFGNAVLNLPGSCLPFLASASAEQLRVLIALSSDAGKTAQGLCSAADVSEDRLAEALLFWEKAGVIAVRSHPAPIKEPYADAVTPAYTGEDMARIADSSDVRELVDVCAAILGKTFTPAESEAVFYLYDGLRLDFEYIVRLCKYCHDVGKPSLRYMKKTAISLYDGGTVTVGALEAFIEREERKSDMEYKIRLLYGIGERVLTPTEKQCIARWVIDWNLPYEVIELGYYQMMASIPAPKMTYENKILSTWYNEGCRTKEDVENYLPKGKQEYEKKKQQEAAKDIGFDLDEFFAAATLRGDGSSESGT
ncbi:MAG: DnaD domain protein [Clostridia bacterium]|nr:DnaD domain protein [Clostridia bacterium]